MGADGWREQVVVLLSRTGSLLHLLTNGSSSSSSSEFAPLSCHYVIRRHYSHDKGSPLRSIHKRERERWREMGGGKERK